MGGIPVKERTIHNFGAYLGLIVLAIIILFPIGIGLWSSFLPTSAILKGQYLVGHLSLQNYWRAIRTTPILRYLLNSLIISTLTMVLQVLLCSMSAYAFVFLRFKGRNLLFYLVLATMMFPFEAEAIPNFQTIRAMNLLNSYSSMIVPFMSTAIGIFMLRQTFRAVPDDLRKAAAIAGLNHWQFYSRVVMPYAKISVLTLAAYSFLTSWNQYLWPMLVTFSDHYRPVQIGLRQMQSASGFNDWGMIQASAIIVILPTIIVLLCGQHFFRQRENEGAVK